MGKSARKASSKILSPEVQRAPESGGAYSPAEQDEDLQSGLLSDLNENLSSLFNGAASSTESAMPSTGCELGPETESELAAVPDVVGGDAVAVPLDGAAAEPAEASLDSEQFRDLLDALAFSESDVKDWLEETFEFLSEQFGSEHWRLSARQLRILGKPTAQMLNSIWEKLKVRLPDVLANWCEATPGAAAFFVAVGMVVAPKAVKQFRISRGAAEAEKNSSLDTKAEKKPPAKAAPVVVHPAARSNVFNIPVASGRIGE